MINISNADYIYSSGKGVKNINITLKEGSVTGYLGPNGAGKTTTIRMLLGFLKAQNGYAKINDLDCFKDSHIIKKDLGFIAGEIALPSHIKCKDFLKYQCEIRNLKDLTLMNKLIKRFDLDISGNLGGFSKGMKQKVAIISAFMHNPKILILDEPTSGLDPLIQTEFVNFINEQKNQGKTILMSSHMFEEIEKTCESVIIIKNGEIVAKEDINILKSSKNKAYTIISDDVSILVNLGYNIKNISSNIFNIYVKEDDTDKFIKDLSKLNVKSIDIKSQGLEDVFLDFYKKGDR